MKLIIQIPCYNEENTLPDVIRDLPRQLDGIDSVEYLVIDDGSTDNTIEVARQLGVHHILPLGTNRGLATAFLAGINKALELGADIIVNTDGDNQYQGRCIQDLIGPIVQKKLDIVVGARPIDDISHFSWLKKKLQRLGSRVVRQFSGTDIADTTSGFRAYSAVAAMKLYVFNRFTYTLETIIQAGHMNMRIGHVPIETNPKTRESRLFGSIGRYVTRSSSIIIRSYITYKPLRTFLYAAILPALLGIVLWLRFLFFYFVEHSTSGHIQSLLLGVTMLILAFLLCMLGVVADLISVNRRLIQDILFNARYQKYLQDKNKQNKSTKQ